MGRDRQEDISLFLRQYLEGRSNLRMAILLIDARREPQEQDLNMHAVNERIYILLSLFNIND